MAEGIVYILTNPCLDGWIKIGRTDRNDIEERLTELNRPSNIPLSYRAYALYHVENTELVEKAIHNLIDIVDDSLHARETLASGRVREREFFKITPEKAYRIFAEIAKVRGDLDALKLVNVTEEEREEENIAASSRRKPFKFSMVKIPAGATLSFIRDDSITCTVADEDNHVHYRGELLTMSALAQRLLDTPYSAQGPKYFVYDGEVLSDRRDRMENQELDE